MRIHKLTWIQWFVVVGAPVVFGQKHWVEHGAFVGTTIAFFTASVVFLAAQLAADRKTHKPPFEVVMKLTDDSSKKQQDDIVFDRLHDAFQSSFSGSGGIRFDGFDTDGQTIWFYFEGASAEVIRDRVLPMLIGYHLHPGSHFLLRRESGAEERVPISDWAASPNSPTS